jgi:hypothetical protein
LKVQPLTEVVGAEIVSAGALVVSKNAVPVGTVAGVQLAAVLKSAEPGLRSQVASYARAAPDNSAATVNSAAVASSAAAIRDDR